MIELMTARVLCPLKHIRDHWKTQTTGVLPSGTFGAFMKRDRSEDISRFLHFSDNKHPNARLDRAWKIRPIVNTIDQTFKQGYVLGAHVALDEGMLPTKEKKLDTPVYEGQAAQVGLQVRHDVLCTVRLLQAVLT